ncbi:hypothetical protein [Hydrogenophilus thermoluteolus]|uniref:Uncharacterized protein n=1 Tax=Hydrogenophilus thermoluteolus TaxID=297 RepID=A0A2Z6DXU5_HYDTE|nr:hypothetical protein [Hydrogenophilus thermoluteolus]BBD77212.1 hypothetical protein HPTL_0945 [Hydrogenophilus thermoluteolus]
MKRRILRYPCARPCDIGGPALPHIQVADADDPAGETAMIPIGLAAEAHDE